MLPCNSLAFFLVPVVERGINYRYVDFIIELCAQSADYIQVVGEIARGNVMVWGSLYQICSIKISTRTQRSPPRKATSSSTPIQLEDELKYSP